MRLWHERLLNKLPQKQLCGQWRECAALLGNGWGRKHSVVNYVFTHEEEYLIAFSLKVMNEMLNRGYHPNPDVIKNSLLKRHTDDEVNLLLHLGQELYEENCYLYAEHDKNYLQECLENLQNKGITIDF